MNLSLSGARGGLGVRQQLLAPALAALLAAAALAAAYAWRSSADELGLSLEPKVVSMTDSYHKAGEKVRGRFRLVNNSGRPLSIDQFAATCACSASESEDGRPAPLLIAPGGVADFVIKTTLVARQEEVQTFQAVVVSSRDGHRLPDLVATLKVKVKDLLLAYPDRVDAANIAAGRPAFRRVVLATRHERLDLEPPLVTVSDPGWLGAEVVAAHSSDIDKNGMKTHFLVNVSVEPRSGDGARSGAIALAFKGHPPVQIPVEWSVRQSYRLSADALEVRGAPGEVATGKLFYEFSDPLWSDPNVESAPAGVHAEVEAFDASTRLIRVKARIPAGRAGDRPGALLLRVAGPGQDIEIPIAYKVVAD